MAGCRLQRAGMKAYDEVWQGMRRFTAERTADTADEIWLLQHPPVYTLGLAGRDEHGPHTRNGIPVVRTDRGGQITYHGPGQWIAYVLLDLRRRGLGIRPLVRKLENAVVTLLAGYGISGCGRADAPGVYVGDAKIAALGLRVRNGCCYHGLSLNVDMDLTPFQAIDPCGYAGLRTTQLRDLGVTDTFEQVGERLADCLLNELS